MHKFTNNNKFLGKKRRNDSLDEFMSSKSINPLTSPGEGVTVFTYPYLSAGAPAQGESKGLMKLNFEYLFLFYYV